jgi:D-amino-acid dehydrogenase
LTNRHPALRWDPVWSMRNAPWLLAFLASALPAHVKPRAAALHGLIGASLKLHRDWIVKADAAARLRETGWLKAWRSDAVTLATAEQALLAEYGIRSEVLDRQAISALEPNIVPAYKVGLLHTETASVDSPGAVVRAYARMFAGSGGKIRQSEIKLLLPDSDGWRVMLMDGDLSARYVVVALGPWSKDLLQPLGYPWRGARPTLPDSLPMIGPAPRHSGLWLAFAHQHIGFTTGPATGAAIAAMIGGAAPPFDAAPFSPGRYL